MLPLMCTTNTQGHVDYGVPLHANRSTDYRTATRKYHDYIPSMPQEYDCRVKLKLDKDLISTNLLIKDDVKSSYNEAYVLKQDNDVLKMYKAPICPKVNCTRIMQEKYRLKTLPPWKPGISEMKDNYRLQYGYKNPNLPPPAVYAHCRISGTERPLQPTVHPEEKGFWKHLDIYLTDNKMKLCNHSPEQVQRAQEDIITFFAATGKWKTLRKPLPGPLTGSKSVYDKTVFKFQNPPKFLSSAPKHVPHSGMETEYGGKYTLHTKSDLYPYISENGVQFDDSLSGASPWQNNCPPAMYCTDSCHIGSTWPVNAVVDTGADMTYIPQKPHRPCTVTVKDRE